MIGAIIAKQAVRSGFNALNERDLDKFMKAWAEQSAWIYPGDLSVSGKHVGKDAVRIWFEHFMEQFTKCKFNLLHLGVDNIFALNGNNTVLAYWELELTNKAGLAFQNRGITLLNIKGSKVVKGEDFLFKNSGADFNSIWGE
jgi:ketosteroid isomerase-like protein